MQSHPARILPVLAVLGSVACSIGTGSDRNIAAGPGYVPGNAQSSSGGSAYSPPTKHYFEGVLEYRGVHGKPPGEPFSMQCSMRREDLRCDVITKDPSLPMSIGFRGPGNTLCFKMGNSPSWIPISFATVGFLFTLLPADIRQKATKETQSQYRWTGRTDIVLGHRCRELEDRSEEGLRLTCYSPDEYFEGDQKLVPILHQMGFDPGFISSLAEGGIGWRSAEWDEHGTPTAQVEVVRIEPRPIHPATFAGVCGFP